jgi:hypothetical protein
MERVYWYKIRQSWSTNLDSTQGRQTTDSPAEVLKQLKKEYGDRLTLAFYFKDKKRVVMYTKS